MKKFPKTSFLHGLDQRIFDNSIIVQNNISLLTSVSMPHITYTGGTGFYG